MLSSVFISILVWHLGTCQRYAERNPLPVPFEDAYEEYYSEGYDFDETAKDIYRWNVEEFPHPREQFRFCNRMRASFICDPDKILDAEQADKLDSYLKQLYNDTPCLCKNCNGVDGGIVIGIALLKNMFQPYNEHPSQIIRSFAENLRDKWKLGKCDNDILIVVATTDRLSYTDVGKETSSYVSLQEAYRIFLEHKAHFSVGHFYEGLRAMLADYYERTRGIKRPSKAEKLNVGLVVGCVIGVVVLMAVALLVFVFVYRRCRKSEGKSTDSVDRKPEGVPSGWTKQDIKVMFSSLKSKDQPTKYQPCDTEEKAPPESSFKIEEEINTTLATEDSASELLDKELNLAVQGLTFKPNIKKHETDL